MQGQNTHLLLSILIKHLDHKSVSKHPNIQLGIVEVITCLAYLSKDQPSFSTTSAISDLIKHLRKIMQNSHNNETLEAEVIYWNNIYQSAVDSCLVQLSSKVHLYDTQCDRFLLWVSLCVWGGEGVLTVFYLLFNFGQHFDFHLKWHANLKKAMLYVFRL